MTYRAVFKREPDGRWTVEIPKVKGCHSYGRTIGQARDLSHQRVHQLEQKKAG